MASAVSSLNKGDGNERFNAEAAAWDQNPFVHEMSKEAWTATQKFVPAVTTSQFDVLEIGCGTGLLSFLVAEKARQVVAVDAAQGMIDVLTQKLSQPGAPRNITPVCVLLEDPEDASLPPASTDDNNNQAGPKLKYDLITSHLVLHHIPELKPVLTTMLQCLKPEKGMVALTDFEDFGPEAKRFHPESKMGGVERHGINRAWMKSLMEEVGFVDVRIEIGWRSWKSVEKYPGEFGSRGRADKEKGDGEQMQFPFVVCLGRRP